MSGEHSEQNVAELVGREMMKVDNAAQHLGITLDEIKPGYSRMSMVVGKEHLNGFAICHGGTTFALADTAFAYACNSRNRKTVALTCTIHFTKAVLEGSKLTATATEVSLKGRTGIYDIAVSDQTGEIVSQFRGTSYATSSKAFENF